MRPRLKKRSHTPVGVPRCNERPERVQSPLCWRRIDTGSLARSPTELQYDWCWPRRSPLRQRPFQQHPEWKRCAGLLALVAEPAVRVSADPYSTPNLRSKQRSIAPVSRFLQSS